MRFFPLWLLASAALVGCGTSSAVRPILGAKTGPSYRMLTDAELKNLAAKGMAEDKEAILITQPLTAETQDSLTKFFSTKPYRVDLGVLRNPGVEVCIVRGRSNGTPLEPADRKELEEMANNLNATIWPSMRVAPKFGPDGKTPMILPNKVKVISESGGIGKVTARVDFPTESAAKEATKYLDPAYETKISKEGGAWALLATIELHTMLDTDEIEEFQRLAKRFKGTYQYVETATEGP